AAGVAFADVGIGSWGRAVFAPVGSLDGETVQSFTTASWYNWTNTPRVGISIHGESDSFGFNIDMNADKDGMNQVGVHDTAFLWAKPWSWLEVRIGKIQEQTARGNLCYGLYNYLRLGYSGSTNGEDLTFGMFSITGATVKITPVEGLWIIGAINTGLYSAPGGDFNPDGVASAAAVFGNNSQYGIGYDIDGVGSVRVKYACSGNLSDKDGNTITNGTINAAFDLTAVENLYLTVGAFVPLAFNATSNVQQVKLAAGANFNLTPVTLHAFVEGYLPNTVVEGQYYANGRIGGGIGADFDFGNGIGLNADVRFVSPQEKSGDDDKSELDFLVGLSKGVTNGSIALGFEGAVENIIGSKQNFVWAVPVVITGSF
ncbi:MAG: hypothetical protein ACI4MA_05675, partial [Treponema sp.]